MTDQTSNTELFLSDSNKVELINTMYKYHLQNGGISKKSAFVKIIPSLMKEYAIRNDLEAITYIMFENFEEVLEFINGEFFETYKDLFRKEESAPHNPLMNPFKTKVDGKKLSELDPDDIRSLNVWKKYTIYAKPSNFRNNNEIPKYRSTIHTRNYDRDNTGSGLEENVSKTNIIRGYDMSDIYKSTAFKDESWF